jgi:hypothetical protein
MKSTSRFFLAAAIAIVSLVVFTSRHPQASGPQAQPSATLSSSSFAPAVSGMARLLAFAPVMPVSVCTLTVINTNDSGAGSLRQAILDANANAGADSICFNIPSAGVQTITPTTPLDAITDPVTIDGYTQTGASANTGAFGAADNAVLMIELNGASAGANTGGFANSGLKIDAGGGGSTIRGLVINRFGDACIVVNSTAASTTAGGNFITGNFIGTDSTGTNPIGAQTPGAGVAIHDSSGNTIGGTANAARNVISGNTDLPGGIADREAQVVITNRFGGANATNNVIQGNYIGINAAGTANVSSGNTDGIYLFATVGGNTIGGTTAGAGNVISGMSIAGIDMYDGSNTIQGNRIGTKADGTGSVTNSIGIAAGNSGGNNVIGGTAAGAGNTVNNSTTGGVEVGGSNNTVQGNTISGSQVLGLTSGGNSNFITGNTISGNGTNGNSNNAGVFVTGDSNTIDSNTISNSGSHGLRLGNGTNNSINANIISNTAAQTNTLGGEGILVGGNPASGNSITGNTIHDNAGEGVVVTVASSTGNSILGNSIYNNGRLGIDLTPTGVTSNDHCDADTGSNNLQNWPVLSTATVNGPNSVTITGALDSTASTSNFRIEFFSNDSCDSSTNGEGKTYLGFANVSTDVNCNAPINLGNFTTLAVVTAGQFITATATDASNNTSEFSNCATAAAPPPADISGTVTFAGTGLAGVTMTLAGTQSGTTTTAGDGTYTFTSLPAGTYSVTPAKTGYTFTPDHRDVTLTGTNVSGQNFTAARATDVNGGGVCDAPPPGMIGWWAGEGNATDDRGENNGTPQNGVTFPAGEVEHAFSFNGVNQFVDFPSVPLTATDNWTMETWINPANLSQLGMVMSNGFDNGTSGDGYAFGIANGCNGDPSSCAPGNRLQGLLSGVAFFDGGFTFPAANQWYHVAMVRDSGTVKFYVNGVQTPNTSTATPLTPTQFRIGSQTGIRFFNGLVDEPSLYSRALSQSEVQDIVNAGTAGKCRPRCATPPSGMVSWYTGDDNPFDIFGTNHGTLVGGATFAAGKVGRAFSLNSGGYVSLANEPAFDLSSAITVDAWAKLTGSTADFAAIVAKGDSAWRLQRHSNTNFAAFGTTGLIDNADLVGTTNINDGQWHHIAGVFDGSTKYLYVDGVLEASASVTGTIALNDAEVRIGDNSEQTGRFWNGLIDEVEVFNRALSASEIQSIVNAAHAGKCKKCLAPPSGMVGWWDGDANANDSSPTNISPARTSDDGSKHANANTGDSPLSGNNGTLQNGAGFRFGKVGQAFNLNGTNQYVSVSDSPSLRPANVTVDGWFNFSSTSGEIVLFGKPVGGGVQDSYVAFLNNGTLFAGVNDTDLISASFSPSLNTWYHIALTYGNSSETLYINGIAVASVALSTVILYDTHDFLIGADSDNGTIGFFFPGMIDEVELFNRALSPTEIQSIVAAGASGKCKSTCPAIPVFDAANPGGQAITPAQSPCFLLTEGNHPEAIQTDLVGDAAVTVDASSTGSTDYQTLDIYSAGPMPFGYDIPIEIADISTTKTFTGNAQVCFTLQAVTDQTTFNQLRVLHLEGNLLIDRTSSHFFAQRQLCATTTTLSPFVISQNASLAPTAANGSVTGTITDASGAAVSGVKINLSGTESRDAITDSGGHYSFDNVETNGFYTVTPTRANYTFSPANRSFSLLGVHTEASFTATANSGDHLNAIDTTEFFVRQHYLDFLGREPDAPGLAGWVSTLNNCAAGDASCDRVHVSEMFFRSAEFQERGYFAYRFYSAAFGRKPNYGEFTPDLARVSGFLTNDQLQAAKTQFANDFASRPAFVAQYRSLTNEAYVNSLASTAGIGLTNRQALIDSLNAGAATRAQVLRQIAESGEVYAKYYNQAFVVMEYFGYLHRDPDALYLNWIDVLNANPADSRRMVDGFVNSAEYRNRFVP